MTTTAGVWAALLENRQRAIRVARARGAHPDEIDDIVQEAMTRVAAMPDIDLDRVGSLITVVVANLTVDGHRARARAARLKERVTAGALSEAAPDEAVCDAAEARWLWSLRDELGHQDRRVLELRADGRTLAQAAAELGVTYKAAENALGRARKRLKTAWAATAALLGILWGRRPAQPAAAWAAAPVALLAAALAVLSPGTPVEPMPRSPDESRPAVDLTLPLPRDAAAAPAPAPLASAVGPDTGPAQPPPDKATVPTARPAAVSPVVETEPVEVLDHQVTPVVVTKEGDRPFLEEVEHCVRKGPVVRPDYIGCPP